MARPGLRQYEVESAMNGARARNFWQLQASIEGEDAQAVKRDKVGKGPKRPVPCAGCYSLMARKGGCGLLCRYPKDDLQSERCAFCAAGKHACVPIIPELHDIAAKLSAKSEDLGWTEPEPPEYVKLQEAARNLLSVYKTEQAAFVTAHKAAGKVGGKSTTLKRKADAPANRKSKRVRPPEPNNAEARADEEEHEEEEGEEEQEGRAESGALFGAMREVVDLLMDISAEIRVLRKTMEKK